MYFFPADMHSGSKNMLVHGDKNGRHGLAVDTDTSLQPMEVGQGHFGPTPVWFGTIQLVMEMEINAAQLGLVWPSVPVERPPSWLAPADMLCHSLTVVILTPQPTSPAL